MRKKVSIEEERVEGRDGKRDKEKREKERKKMREKRNKILSDDNLNLLLG